MCDIQNNGKIQREFETRSTDDQPTIQWLPVVGSWTFLGVNMHFNEKLFMCDSCNFLVKAYQEECNNNVLPRTGRQEDRRRPPGDTVALL